MRIPLGYALAAALLLTSSCSRDEKPAPAATPATTSTTAQVATPAPAARPKEAVFIKEELDQMVAPVALYPDSLLAQVLMAATYPGDVADAAAWAKAHPDAKGDDAVKQVASQPWDPSVQSLVAFPQALATLGQDPAWVQRLGDAFLAQPEDVMDAVQRLRRQAQTAGNLKSNEYQKVTEQPAPAPAAAAPAMGGVESAPAAETIIIEPSNPETVYVPSYDPTTAYGNWAYPSYPPTYYPPPPNYYPLGGALATGLMFGVGVAAINSLWGNTNWNNGDIDINVNNYNSINSNRQIDRSQNTFRHNAANRDGVPYRDRGNRDANNRRLDGADSRTEFRGEDANRARSREQARASMEKRGVETPARTNQEARDRAQAASGERAQAGSRDQARNRAQASTQRQPQRSAQNRQQGTQKHRQSQSNTQARSAARNQQQTQTRREPKNNAFQGASRPQQSRASDQRGRNSQASAQRSQSSRSQSSRSAGKPAQRQSRPPQQRQQAQRR
ncbi:MAG TPA: DUF3300 domain-containing protein [Luteimonas sp.]|nr:DUF3300 domain-containing protein [Luteimonas sp.]